jgi:hypothetical protein
MSIELNLLHIGGTLGGLLLMSLGYWLGKRAKLNELHKLQREGYLKIEYLNHQQGKGDVRQLMMKDQSLDDDEHLEVVAYPRRSRNEKREIDFAKKLREDS